MRYSTPAEPISDLRAIATKAQSEIIQRREPVFMTQNADEWHMSEAWRERLGADEDLETKQHRDSVSPAMRSETAIQKIVNHSLPNIQRFHRRRI